MSLKRKWINLIYSVATGSRKLRMLMTPIVGLSYLFFGTLFVIVSFPVDALLNLPKLLPKPIHMVLSIPLFTIGGFLIIWTQFHFFKAKGTPVPFNPPPKLVTVGPYAYVRNPMLSGIFLLLYGFGTAFRSLSLVFIFAPLFIVINVLELKAIEEPELEMRLGNEYIEYRKRVPMFFPNELPLFGKKKNFK